MIPEFRRLYNESFSEAKYAAFLDAMNREHQVPIGFRVAETPVFVPVVLKQKLLEACENITGVIRRDDFLRLTNGAVPVALNVPKEDAHPQFIAIDFAICRDEAGELIPQLIELQGFPSLYGFQELLSRSFRTRFNVPATVSPYFSGLNTEQYIALLRKTIVGQHSPENVILLEIEPEKQKTNIDFLCTQAMLGVKSVCISKVIKEGRRLFYRDQGKTIPVHRIYNRVIFDELVRRNDLACPFNLTDEVEVEWAGHPNWFFRISKSTMPLLHSPYVPESRLLSDFVNLPGDLEHYVLKPLYSFAGAGVKFDVNRFDLEEIPVGERHHYLLQKKVSYEPVIKAIDGGLVKTEIRMLYLWPEGDVQPTLAINLARLSRGVMIGVDFNKNKTWVGGTVAFFEAD